MPTKLNKLFANLKSTVVGTNTQKVDRALDDAVKDIISYKSHSGRNGYIDLVKTVISKSSSGMNLGVSSGGLFSHSASGPAAFGQGARMMRYKSYEAIVSNIDYAKRALQVIVDNILSPDDITKVVLDVKPKEYLEDETPTQSKVKRVKEVISEIDIEERLHILVKNTLLYGDFFCEMADAKTALTSKSIITESENYNNNYASQRTVWNESIEKDNKLRVTLDFSSFNEQAGGNNETKRLKNLSLIFHKPSYVVKLQSALFPICFGYLIFPQIRGIGLSGATLEDDVVNNICTSILKNLQDKIPQMAEFKDDDELKDIIKFMVRKSNPNQALDIRYVPPDKMVHFRVPSEKYYPYGESIFDGSQYSAKVLMSLETALAVQRLSRSTEKRKIAVEVGLPRDAKKAIEAMKEEFRKRKVSLDSFGTVDTIPSMITTFEDVYIPQKDGKAFVDISTFNEGNVDVRSKVDELKFMRDQLTASWGVPPSFIGIEENLSNKCLSLFTKIKLLSSRNIFLKDLIQEFNETGELKDKYTYSYDKETGKIVPGKIVWAGVTRKNATVVKVTLDNGKYEIVTPDHHYMLRDGEYIEAQELNPGDSLMPLYIEIPQKAVSVEFLNYTMDTGDITVEKYHNFAVSSGVIVSNSALSEENILFARTVITHQKYLSHDLTELLQKVFDIINPDDALTLLDNVDIHLPPPRSLQFEREARYMNEITGLIEGLERIGIPKEYSKRKYLAHYDWDEIKKYEIDEKVETTLDPTKKEEDGEMGGFGGGGMGGSY